jgi:hypothetical protein
MTMRKLLVLAGLPITGLAMGIGAGLWLAEAPADPDSTPAEAVEGESTAEPEAPEEEGEAPEFAKLNNQFIVPVVEQGQVAALVILSISLEVSAGKTEQVFAVEPRLRDSLLRVLFDHANNGGFAGHFTNPEAMTQLRRALLEAGRQELGHDLRDVLILDIVRQDS